MDDEPFTNIEDQLLKSFDQMMDTTTDDKQIDTNEVSKTLASDKQFNLNLQRFIESRLIMGVSPTGNKAHTTEEKGTSNKGKHKHIQLIFTSYIEPQFEFFPQQIRNYSINLSIRL